MNFISQYSYEALCKMFADLHGPTQLHVALNVLNCNSCPTIALNITLQQLQKNNQMQQSCKLQIASVHLLGQSNTCLGKLCSLLRTILSLL